MILNYIGKIVKEEENKGSNPLYVRTVIKEYLQIVILQFIYTNAKFKSNFIFTGGTCLRHFYGIERLSEDLDFDYLKLINPDIIVKEISDYFAISLKYSNLDISIKQKGKQILLKFPILNTLGLAGPNDSDMLYIKIDQTPVIGSSYTTQKTSKSAFGYNFIALHYALSSLFAGKISAILTRNLQTGQDNKQTIKGRDFYDLLWYLKNDVGINLNLVKEKLDDNTLTIKQIKVLVDDKVNLACTRYKQDFERDLIPFISNQNYIADYVDNYLDEYKRYRIRIDR